MKKQFLCISTLIAVCNIHSADTGALGYERPQLRRKEILLAFPHRNLKPEREENKTSEKKALTQIKENSEESNKNNE